VGTSKTKRKRGRTTSLKAAVKPGHWLQALIYNSNNVFIILTGLFQWVVHILRAFRTDVEDSG
jgi:hypothetical protein